MLEYPLSSSWELEGRGPSPATLVGRMGTCERERFGPYQLEDLLGEGAMGVVYRGVHAHERTEVAVKILRIELAEDPEYMRRFLREGEIASRLAHPHLVAVVDRGAIRGRPFLVTRYVKGQSLATHLGKGPLPTAVVARLVGHVGSALDELHRRALVHRDVKPANILLDEKGRAVLTDFGVARGAADSTLTKPGRVVGTVDYLAPEVIAGRQASPASDIYSLGCLAYEAAVGRPPYACETVAQACVAHLQEPPPDPRALAADMGDAFAAALVTALAKEPSRRPATGTAYGRLLRTAAKGG